MDKITEQDLANRGVKGLPDVPGLTTEEMQRKLEEIAREILIPKVNELVEGLNNANSNLQNANKSITMNAFDNGVLANGLLVDLYDKNGVNNKPKLVLINTTENLPSDCTWGTREVFFYSCNETAKVSYLIIKITGCDTDGKPGLWQNLFNGNDWYGWVRIGS